MPQENLERTLHNRSAVTGDKSPASQPNSLLSAKWVAQQNHTPSQPSCTKLPLWAPRSCKWARGPGHRSPGKPETAKKQRLRSLTLYNSTTGAGRQNQGPQADAGLKEGPGAFSQGQCLPKNYQQLSRQERDATEKSLPGAPSQGTTGKRFRHCFQRCRVYLKSCCLFKAVSPVHGET